jgi:hypothetical protein
MSTMKKLTLLLLFALFVAAPISSIMVPQNSVVAATIKSAPECERKILNINPWYRGLAYKDSSGSCSVAGPGQQFEGDEVLELQGFIWRIALNVIEIVLSIVGILAFFFMLYGGFQFLTGGNNPSQIESARKTIINAAIGVIISIGAVAIVNLIFGIIG